MIKLYRCTDKGRMELQQPGMGLTAQERTLLFIIDNQDDFTNKIYEQFFTSDNLQPLLISNLIEVMPEIPLDREIPVLTQLVPTMCQIPVLEELAV